MPSDGRAGGARGTKAWVVKVVQAAVKRSSKAAFIVIQRDGHGEMDSGYLAE